MNELSRKEEIGSSFSKMQNDYFREVSTKYNGFTRNLDTLLSDSVNTINGVMMELGVGLA